MMLPFKSLDGVGAVGVGAVKDLETAAQNHTMWVTTTGSPDSFGVGLQLSPDGIHWRTVGSFTHNTAIAENSNDYIGRYVRAELASISGGTSPTVTAWIASVP